MRFVTSPHDFDLKLTIAVDLLSMAAEKQLQLFGLYVSQGAPYGFQANVLPILFRDWGKSYNSNGLLYLSYLPWVMKPLAAPFLEKSNLSSVSKTLIISAIIQIMIAYAVMQKSSNSLIILYLIDWNSSLELAVFLRSDQLLHIEAVLNISVQGNGDGAPEDGRLSVAAHEASQRGGIAV